jgi:cytochrome c peroxidase
VGPLAIPTTLHGALLARLDRLAPTREVAQIGAVARRAVAGAGSGSDAWRPGFTLRGIKDSPPYLHDGRALTLEDSVEFFNLVLELKLTPEEKHNLVEFVRQL